MRRNLPRHNAFRTRLKRTAAETRQSFYAGMPKRKSTGKGSAGRPQTGEGKHRKRERGRNTMPDNPLPCAAFSVSWTRGLPAVLSDVRVKRFRPYPCFRMRVKETWEICVSAGRVQGSGVLRGTCAERSEHGIRKEGRSFRNSMELLQLSIGLKNSDIPRMRHRLHAGFHVR